MTVALDDFLAEVGQSAFGWPQSLRFTHDTTVRLLADGVPGDFVECGVGAGVHPAAMARAITDAGGRRTVRLFDSFRGVPHGSSADVTWNEHYGDGSGRLEPTGVAVCGLADVQANLERWGLDGDLFAFHPGWFQEVLTPELLRAWREKGDGIAFLRLDGDLYESTKVCLGRLYPLLNTGGVLVIDDLNLDGCRQAVRDYGLDPDAFTPITESGDGYIIKA